MGLPGRTTKGRGFTGRGRFWAVICVFRKRDVWGFCYWGILPLEKVLEWGAGHSNIAPWSILSPAKLNSGEWQANSFGIILQWCWTVGPELLDSFYILILEVSERRVNLREDFFRYKNPLFGLPWWRSGWESACQCRGHGFEPWSGKIPHATEQLGPWATITEPVRLEPVLRSKRGCDSERPAHRDEEWSPLAATRESPRTETKTQHSHK